MEPRKPWEIKDCRSCGKPSRGTYCRACYTKGKGNTESSRRRNRINGRNRTGGQDESI